MMQTTAEQTDKSRSASVTIKKGLDFLVSGQAENGRWSGTYDGPMFLLPIYVIACYITGRDIPQARKKSMIGYLTGAQKKDGSIGLHLEDDGAMFTTVLSFIALRFLGLKRTDPRVLTMRSWIRKNGTALGTASWGKLFLALLNLTPYDGLDPILPELWLLPDSFPMHPGRLWCHCRQVYLPMAYLYGVKATIRENILIRELREDLYTQPYWEIDFSAYRGVVAPSDDRVPTSRLLKVANQLMVRFEKSAPSALRQRALSKLLTHIHYEDAVTGFIDIGPVNSVLNTLVHHFDAAGKGAVRKSFDAMETYLHKSENGLGFGGYNSTALWDTAFAAQAICATSFSSEYADALGRAWGFIKENQINEELPEPEKHYRHRTRGGWPFSDREHGWPISDCTAEGFKSTVALEEALTVPMAVDQELLEESILLILSLQNRDGGWATYEKQRGGGWLESLNPSQVFGDIMVDYSYVECTSACIQALQLARRKYSKKLVKKIDRAIGRGVKFIKRAQWRDGSWKGSWAVCFTYGTWFGVWGLLAGGISYNAPEIRKAIGFLLSHQRADGGFGEHYKSCVQDRYVQAEQSTAVHTAWALLTLVRSGMANTAAVRRAADFLIDRQLDNGDWPREPMIGVFNKTTVINYENYRRYFPIWALAELLNESVS
jgi:squalene/oxidosqualene cyclase-like protein